MPLLDLLRDAPAVIESMNLEQLVRVAGGGDLRDHSDAQTELREFLTTVSPDRLAEFAEYCLKIKFEGSGFVLQDVVNEMGRRLGFSVENGRWQGKQNHVGFDGLWHSETAGWIVLEVKTSDAHFIKLETPAGYRDKLISQGKVSKNTTILFAVGNQYTKGLEQQIRGSEFAFDMRVVGINALAKLMDVNVDSNSDEVTEQIHQIFKPIDYIRVDPIVDIVFTTAEDKEQVEEAEDEINEGAASPVKTRSNNREAMRAKRAQIADTLSKKYGKKLVRRKIALFSDSNESLGVAISISKRYEPSTYAQYWYAYLAPMRKFLSVGGERLMVFGFLDKDVAYAIPFLEMERLKEGMNTTPKKDNRDEYWHVFIKDIDGPARLYLSKSKQYVDIEKYKVDLSA